MKLDFNEVAEEAEAICNWLESFRLNVNPSRVARYKARLREIAASVNGEAPEIERSNLSEYHQALFEYGELSILYQAFHDSSPRGIETLLNKIISGPFSYANEASNTTPRNFAFEASLGARIALAGLPVSFAHTGDVYTEVNGFPLYFQCKRMSSIKQTKDRVKYAVKQIRKDVANHKGSLAHGFIALDVTKLNNSDATTMVYKNSAESDKEANQLRISYIQNHLETLNIKLPTKVIGILIRSSFLYFNQEEQAYGFAQDYTIAYISELTPQKKQISDLFYNALNSNNAPRRLTQP